MANVSGTCYNNILNPNKEWKLTMNTSLTRGEAKDTIDFAIEQFINEIEVSDGMLLTLSLIHI